MTIDLPQDVQEFVSAQLSSGAYRSAEELVGDALRVLKELKSKQDQLVADVAVGIDQADCGLARALDVDALISRVTTQLAAEGIRD